VVGCFDATTRLWDAESGAELAVMSGHGDVIETAVFDPGGTRVLTAGGDGTARVWDAESGIELVVLDADTKWLASAAFSPDGTRIVTAGMDGTAKIWAAGGAELLRIAEETLAGSGTAQ